MKQIRDLARRLSFLKAGEDSDQQMEAALLSAEIDRTYLLWGLVGIDGLDVDGTAATPDVLISDGPENLLREALSAVKEQFGLSENEKGN